MRTTDDIELAVPAANKDAAAKSSDKSKKPEDVKPKKKTIGYWGLGMCLIVMILLWIACIVLRYKSIDWGSLECEIDNTDDTAEKLCIRQNAIYRVAAIVSAFFGLHGIVSMFNVVDFFDYYWILVKLPAIVAGSYLIVQFPSGFFDDDLFVWWARIGAFIFIIFQQIILLDFAYMWNSNWFARYESKNPMVREMVTANDCSFICRSVWLIAILAVAAVLFAVFITGMVLMYHYYGGSGCTDSNTIITISLLGMIGAGVVQLSSSNGSLLTTTVLMVYVTYVTYASVSLNPNESCNPLVTSTSHSGNSYGTGPAITGLVISLASILYMSTITARSISVFFSHGDTANVIEGKTSGAAEKSPDLKKKLRRSIFFYCVVYSFLALYLSMTMTNWGIRVRSLADMSSDASKVGMWMQASAAWITIALYLVALISPLFKIIPDSVWDFYPTSINSA